MKINTAISLKVHYMLFGISLIILFSHGCVIFQNGDSKHLSSREDDRPNILMLISEDHGPELGIYGDPFARTPVLDRLGAEGVVFDRAYTTQAGCSPSRASLMTGLYPHQHGQIGLATHGFRLYQDTEILLLPNALKQAGYRTGIVGKLHVNPEANFKFDMRLKGDSFRNRDVHMVAENAMQFLNKTDGDKPFYLSVNYADVHRPYIGDFIKQADGLPENPHEPGDVDILPHIGFYEDLHAEKAANYYNSIERLDTGIGILLDQMIASGNLENTIIIYFSDHGSDMFRAKTTVYEGGTRVPLIIHWGDYIKTGQRREELVSINDFVPTLLELAEVEVPEILPGKSLLPLLQNQEVEWREYLYTEYHIHSAHNLYPQRAVRNDRFKLIHNLHHGKFNPGYAWRFNIIYGDKNQNGREHIEKILEEAPLKIQDTYANLKRAPEYELYDLKNDPNEFNNLAENESFREIKEKLIATLHDWQVRTKDPLLNEDNLRILEYEVYGAFENREYLVEDDNGNLVIGEYNRVRRGDDYWTFYRHWKSFIESH